MTRATVKAVLDAIGSFRYSESVLGFDFIGDHGAHGFRDPDKDMRLQKGSGIAEDNRWFLSRIRGEERDLRGPVSTKRELRRIMIEWLTEKSDGPKPPPRDGYTIHAKKNRNSFGEHYVWCYRKAARK